jgi:hypothetical protein
MILVIYFIFFNEMIFFVINKAFLNIVFLLLMTITKHFNNKNNEYNVSIQQATYME